jgi:hypothetical protein
MTRTIPATYNSRWLFLYQLRYGDVVIEGFEVFVVDIELILLLILAAFD